MTNYTRCIAFLAMLIIASSVNAQQIYKFALKFNDKMFADPKVKDSTRLRLDALPDSLKGVTGYVVQPDGTQYSIHTFALKNRVMHIPKQLHKGEKLRGIVDYREGDTLYIHFWYITSNDNNPQQKEVQVQATSKKIVNNQYVTKGDNEKEFLFFVPWDSSGGLHYNIPMFFRCLTATNIPIRYNFRTKKTDASLLNFNMTYFWCKGRRKFFRNQDLNSRDEYFGVGPFFGFLQDQNNTDPTTEFAFTYGISGVFYSTGVGGFNIIPSVGFENGLTQPISKAQFFCGIGLGINVASFGSYHN